MNPTGRFDCHAQSLRDPAQSLLAFGAGRAVRRHFGLSCDDHSTTPPIWN
jgi:hypothetical protein